MNRQAQLPPTQCKAFGSPGVSTLETIVAAGILGIVVLVSIQEMSFSMRATRAAKDRQDLMQFKERVIQEISCTQSLIGGCKATDQPLKSKNGLELLPANGSKSGMWSLRAKCDATAKHIIVEAAQLKPGSTTQFMTHPLDSSKTLSWSSANLIGADVGLCNKYIGSGSGTALVPTLGGTQHPAGGAVSDDCPAPFSSYKSKACPTGTTIVGGGARCSDGNSPGDPETIFSEMNVAGNYWHAKCCHSAGVTMHVWAVCLGGP